MEPLRKNRFHSKEEVLEKLKSYSLDESEDTSFDDNYHLSQQNYKHPDTRPEVVYGGPIPKGFDDPETIPASNKRLKKLIMIIIAVLVVISIICMIKF